MTAGIDNIPNFIINASIIVFAKPLSLIVNHIVKMSVLDRSVLLLRAIIIVLFLFFINIINLFEILKGILLIA